MEWSLKLHKIKSRKKDSFYRAFRTGKLIKDYIKKKDLVSKEAKNLTRN
jgi:hypothetical protein